MDDQLIIIEAIRRMFSEQSDIEFHYVTDAPIRSNFAFFSAEFPEYVNQGYNDTFTVSLSSPSHNFANVSSVLPSSMMMISYDRPPATSVVDSAL